MNNEMMSIVFASDNEVKLNELTLHRTTASLPFCGRYRFIDFTLSNLVNSNITSIGIVTRSNYLSLMDHIRMGRDWDLNRKSSGIVIFPPYVSNTARTMYKGKIDALYSIMDYIQHRREPYVVLTNSNIASNIDYEDVLRFHLENEADITMMTYNAKPTTSRRVVVKSDKADLVTDMFISDTPSDSKVEMGLNIYLIKKELLVDIIKEEYTRGNVDFEYDCLLKLYKNMKVCAYKSKGYSAIIDDIKSYYYESMNALKADIRNDLFYRYGKIFTKVKDSVPTIYRNKAKVKNSLIADGCDINGTVENSILFRGVKVEEGAVIKNSIVMEKGLVMRNSMLNYTITDKNVVVKENRTLSGYETYPVVIVKDKEV